MNRDIKKRKIRFWAFLMALVLMLPCTPITVEAATDYTGYDEEWKPKGDQILNKKVYLHPGDIFKVDQSYASRYIEYYQSNGTACMKRVDASAIDDTHKHIVLNYSDLPNQEDDMNFGAWKIDYAYGSSGEIRELNLVAVPKKTITYHIVGDDVTNSFSYVVGEGVTAFYAPPTRDGYEFDGWYTDVNCSGTKETVESSKHWTGNIDLYGKFNGETHKITYYVNGEKKSDLEVGNAGQYKVGTGLTAFYEPSVSEGVTLDGWYTTDDYSGDNKVSVNDSKSWTTDKKLYGRYKYKINYNLEQGETLEEGNPTSYTYGEEKSVDDDFNVKPSKKGYSFEGWYTDEGRTIKFTRILRTQTGVLNLYANFTTDTYTLAYEYMTGASVDPANPTSYTVLTPSTTLHNPTKIGYDFHGWFSERTFDNQVTQIGGGETGNKTLYAKFTLKTHTITYHTNGGEALSPTSHSYGANVVKSNLPSPTRTGYTFKEWCTDPALSTPCGDTITVKGNIDLYAEYTPKEYSITFDPQDGTTYTEDNSQPPTEFTYGTGIPEDSFEKIKATKDHCNFLGWYDGTGEGATEKTSIVPTTANDVTLYAKYQGKEYTINYILNGGTNAASNPDKYYFGTGVPRFENADKEGYTFDGWYSDAGFNTRVTGISEDSYDSVTLYAKFTEAPAGSADPATYQITYQLDGGTNGAGNPTNYTYGVGVSSFADADKEGYTFDGWYSDAGFTKKVTKISDSQSGNVTLYAKFEANRYKIQYELNGGTNGAGNPESYTYGKGVSGFADASKEGYTFDGWYSDETYTTKVTGISADQQGDVTIYAKFSETGSGDVTPATYQISYELNGGTNGAGNPTSYIYGKGVTGFADAVKEGYTFDGWYGDAGFTKKVTSISDSQTGDVTLYAKFEANRYGIQYELDGGTNGAGNPESYTYGKGVTGFADAVKEGYVFRGWYSDADFTTPLTSISERQIGRVTLYAKYAKKYAITYVLDGGTNARENPESYVVGTGVAQFADAVKEGYTFEGWYGDAGFTTKVTDISATQVGDVTLYAKFVAEKEENSEIEDEDGKKSKKKKTDGLSDDAPKGDKSLRDAKGDNPETGDNSPIALGFWIFAISGLAILFLRRYIVRLKKKN